MKVASPSENDSDLVGDEQILIPDRQFECRFKEFVFKGEKSDSVRAMAHYLHAITNIIQTQSITLAFSKLEGNR